MTVPLDKFVKQLEDSGILAGDTIKDFIPPKASPKDAEELARELVRKKKLTKFQAEEVSKGKGKSLVLGNYVLMEKIGAGGMGQVFKAEHRRMHRTVAIKMLPPNVTKDAAAIARFEREVTAAAKLRHPNIVAADDADCANGIHFLVMELVEGQDLSALVKKNGPCSVENAVNYILQAARGLEAAHKKGVVHRDIKPANLLLDTDGVVKILDMGLARLSLDGDDAPQADLTSTGTIMGTVDYMAPEQALDTKAADARADIYALGCSLFFLLTGKSTYEGDTLMKKLLAHREQPIPALRKIRPEVTEQHEVVFKKLVAKKVEDRYQSMTEVIVELELCTASPTTSLTIQQPATTTFQDGAFDFLKKLPEEPTILAKPQAKATAGKTGNNKKLALIGAAVLAVAILAGIIVSLQTKDGKLIVEVDQPGAMVQVLDSEGKVEISQKGGVGKITISVDPGKHRLKVVKDGFTTFGQEFEMEKNGKKEITAKLVPLETKPAMVEEKPVPNAGEKKPLAFQMPGFEQWAKDVQAMPAEKQVKAISEKLMELNPGFDGKLTPGIENGVVLELRFFTNSVTDISPVRALVGLFTLDCEGADPGEGHLRDLSPLKGMSLQYLSILRNAVSDLSPLQGLPLTHLNIRNTQISDLSPLQGMKLTHLFCSNSTHISDLSPLKGMPLKCLQIESSRVNDLSPLKGMPLDYLDIGGSSANDKSLPADLPLTTLGIQATQITDQSPLLGMPLKSIHIWNFKPSRNIESLRSIKTLETISDEPAAEFWRKYDAGDFGKPEPSKPITDFNSPAFQQWMKEVQALPAVKQVEAVRKKMMELNPGFDGRFTGSEFGPDRKGVGTPIIQDNIVWNIGLDARTVSDISPLRVFEHLWGLKISGYDDDRCKLTDLSPLKGMKLQYFACDRTEVSDLSPLKDVPLKTLMCWGTKVTDLSPLKGMELKNLVCGGNQISDLTPLRGMPLETLGIPQTNVSDLSPLAGMSLTELAFDHTKVSSLSVLKGMPLKKLHCQHTGVTDLSPLADMPLEEIRLTPNNITQGIDVIRAMKGMKTIGLEHDDNKIWSPDDFWKKYDAGEFANPQ